MVNLDELLLEQSFLDNVLNTQIRVIDSNTRFWMIRTKKGYFYDEFLANGFVALAWNIVTESTDFSDSSLEALKDQVLLNYQEIKRPTTVINKCNSFIHDVKTGDYIVIPNAGSAQITIAVAGEYYEETTKTYEIEKEVISRIESKDVSFNEVSCPYRKRRRINPIATVSSAEIDGKLFKAISNYHGISSLDEYSRSILGIIYDAYRFKGNLNVVFHINRTEPVGPRNLSKLLWAATDCWCELVDEQQISTQVSVSSPGPVDFEILNLLENLVSGANILFGLTLGGIAVVKPEVIPTFLKNIFSLPAEISREYIAAKREKIQLKRDEVQLQKETKTADLDIEARELSNFEKKLDILDRLKAQGIDPDKVHKASVELASTFEYLQIGSIEDKSRVEPLGNPEAVDEMIEDDIEEETV